jgi:enoyl-CoA hydratase
MSTPEPFVSIERDGPIRTITIHNERYSNAVTPPMHREFLKIWQDLILDDEAGVVILTGSGGSFSAGGDIDGMVSAVSSEEHRFTSIHEARAIVNAITHCPLPTIAAVNGPAVGAGATFALLCDLAVISEDAYISDPHVSVGLVAGDGGALVWPLLVGLSRAKQYLFTGDQVPAAQAVELGLAVSAHPAGEVLDAARALAERLLAQPTYALRATKAALNVPLHQALASGMEASMASELASLNTSAFRDQVDTMVRRRDERRAARAAREAAE